MTNTQTINWSGSTKDIDLISQIVDRAAPKNSARMRTMMDLIAAHLNGCPLDLHALLAADDFTFWHDVNGIQYHIDRNTGKLLNCFVPRTCAKLNRPRG